jgi:hypothetical protein
METPEPLFRCAKPGLCARLGLLRRACESDRRNWGETPEPLVCAALGLVAALGVLDFSVRAYKISVVGETPEPLPLCARPGRCAWLSSARGCAVLCRSRKTPESFFSAALGLAAALYLAFFSMRSSWIVVVLGDPRTPFLGCAQPGCCA